MQDMIDKARQYTDVFIFGCGDVGHLLYEDIVSANIDTVIRFCDNYVKTREDQVEVLSPEEAFCKYPHALFIIGSTLYHAQMRAQLMAMGVDPQQVYSIKDANRFIVQPFLDRIEYDLAEHCNLNCAGCVHFSNIADARLASLEDFKTDMYRFVQVMGNRLKGILLLGGEPLLNPHVEQFIRWAREWLPHGNIGITTNGTLLKHATPHFWRTCAQCRVTIVMSLYPINVDYAGISALAQKYNVRLETRERRSGGWGKFVLDVEGCQDGAYSFSHCGMTCAQLKNGRVYPCGITTGIHHFNAAFHQRLLITDEDGLDIHGDISFQDVLNFLAKPIPFCRYCKITARRSLPWSPSKHTMDEYVDR